MAPATVLTFNLPEADFERLRALAASLGIRAKAVPPESFTLPLGAMLGIPVGPSKAPVNGQSFDDPMLLMCNLTLGNSTGCSSSCALRGCPASP